MKPINKKEGKLAKAFKLLFVFAIFGTGLVTLVGGLLFAHYSSDLPKLITVADYRPLTVSRVYDSAGILMGEFYLERRYLIPYEKMPDLLVRAFISAEDDQFFQHQGVNFTSILRAGIANFKAGHVVQGGSTITQQVAKSLLLTSERSFTRKIKEVILAYRIERNLTKQQILYLYLNQIYLGHSAHGVQAAARLYYRKDVSELTLSEAAMLGGMPQAPGKYSPLLNPKKAKERQLYVLRRMFENHFITKEELKEASDQPLKIFQDEEMKLKYSPFLIEHVRKYLFEKFGEDAVNKEGLTITLPTQASLVLKAKKQLQDGLRTVDQRSGYRGPIEQLKSDTEIEKKLKSQRMKLLNRRLGFQILTSDGRLDHGQAIAAAGLKSESELLEIGEPIEAVVTQVDDTKKTVVAMVGAIRVVIPIDKMRWAHWNKEGKSKADPKVPSQVVSHGDVIWVKPEKIDNASNVIASFEQIPAVQGALFSLEAQTGNVLAMEGGYDFELSEFNRAFQAKRQPGSAFKPVIYSAGIENGFTPATIIVDSPLVYSDAENGKWKPANYEEKFYGDTTFRQALIKSRNVPTIKIMQAVQVPNAIEFARRIGMTTADLKPDLSTALGSGGVSLFELTKTYAIFPRLGRMVEPIFISQVKDRDGKILEENKPLPSALSQKALDAIVGEDAVGSDQSVAETPTKPIVPGAAIVRLPKYPLPADPMQVLDPRVAYVMTHLMKEVVAYGTGHEAKNLERPAAGKTGTTSDSIDAWFMGFTPFVVTGTWIGSDGQKPIGHNETGARAALPIWLGFMKEAVKNYPEDDFVVPPKIVFATIDQHTGKLVQPNSSTAIKEAFIEGTEPKTMSSTSSNSTESSSDFFKEDSE